MNVNKGLSILSFILGIICTWLPLSLIDKTYDISSKIFNAYGQKFPSLTIMVYSSYQNFVLTGFAIAGTILLIIIETKYRESSTAIKIKEIYLGLLSLIIFIIMYAVLSPFMIMATDFTRLH